jgi:hypothetical protein
VITYLTGVHKKVLPTTTGSHKMVKAVLVLTEVQRMTPEECRAFEKNHPEEAKHVRQLLAECEKVCPGFVDWSALGGYDA